MRHILLKYRTCLSVGVVAISALAVLTTTGGGASAGPPSASALAQRVAAEAQVEPGDDAGYSRGPEARAGGDQVRSRYPLPDGGSFGGIRWNDVDGGITRGEIKAHLQFNAACQWYIAYVDGHDVEDARAVIAAIPDWPMFRSGDIAQLAQQVAATVARGTSGADAVPREFLAGCRNMVARMRQQAPLQGERGPR